PLITPVPELILNPAGNGFAPVTDHVYGIVPRRAATVWLYNVPTVPPGNDGVVITNVAGATVIDRLLSAVCVPSATCTLKVNVPAAVGVPLITPLLAMPRPPGNGFPPVTDHVY